MHTIGVIPLPYQASPVGWFDRLRQLPWAQLLDSCGCQGKLARYDIMVADPRIRITVSQDSIRIESANAPVELAGQTADIFSIIRQHLQDYPVAGGDWPFCGGAMGYFGYDLAEPENSRTAAQGDALPAAGIGIYDWAIISDHELHKTMLLDCRGPSQVKNTRQWLDQLLQSDSLPEAASALQASDLRADVDWSEYQQKFARIQSYLLEGDCYQVNYARCFTAQCDGSAWQSYQQLRQHNPVPFAAFLELPFAQIVSASPERFLQLAEGHVETRPIKGTRRRGDSPAEDLKLSEELAQSSKDRAENLMIVDLLRNDLGKCCVPGSITVPEMFSVERYPTVLHLVSSVQGELAADRDAIDLLQACFPGGSVTGAPKKRAMEIIRELETFRRGIYCGSIGYISYCGKMDSNIAIRTMTVMQNRLSFWAGGGIVADSRAEAEYKETIDKARAFIQLLQSS